MKKSLLMILTLITLPLASFAEDEEMKAGFNHSSELGFVKTGGNTDSETFSLKQDTYYKWGKELLRWTGNYISTKAVVPVDGSIEGEPRAITAENFATALRYERTLSSYLGVYAQAGYSQDRFQGIREKKEGGLGANYHITKTENFWWDFELGYQYTRELRTVALDNGIIHPEFHFARAFTALEYSYSKAVMLGLWVEFLFPFEDQTGLDDPDFRVNFEPYLVSVLSDNFSLKVSYNGRYRNTPVVSTNKNLDYTFSTTLIATY